MALPRAPLILMRNQRHSHGLAVTTWKIAIIPTPNSTHPSIITLDGRLSALPRTQFPVRLLSLAFAMTFNKIQGQSFWNQTPSSFFGWGVSEAYSSFSVAIFRSTVQSPLLSSSVHYIHLKTTRQKSLSPSYLPLIQRNSTPVRALYEVSFRPSLSLSLPLLFLVSGFL